MVHKQKVRIRSKKHCGTKKEVFKGIVGYSSHIFEFNQYDSYYREGEWIAHPAQEDAWVGCGVRDDQASLRGLVVGVEAVVERVGVTRRIVEDESKNDVTASSVELLLASVAQNVTVRPPVPHTGLVGRAPVRTHVAGGVDARVVLELDGVVAGNHRVEAHDCRVGGWNFNVVPLAPARERGGGGEHGREENSDRYQKELFHALLSRYLIHTLGDMPRF